MKRTSRAKKEFDKLMELAKQNFCLCGCENKVTKTGNFFIQGHSGNHKKTSISLTWEEMVELRENMPPMKLCACGCGHPLKGRHSKWRTGHQLYGKNGWNNRKYVNKRDISGFCIQRGKFPSNKEIIKIHQNIIEELIIDPNKCWACQLYKCTEKCHIIAVSDGGENEPENLILLCSFCHGVQHVWAFNTWKWGLKNQYKWLKMMRDQHWGNPVVIQAFMHNNNKEKC